jgi:hypothetical protein
MGDKNDSDSGFDIKYTLLPPELVVKTWTLALDADTSKVNLVYQPGAFTTGVTYEYAGKVSANMAIRRFSSSLSLGFNPTNNNVDLGLVYRGFRFNVTEGFQQRTTAVNLGYGASLLPFPSELESSFRNANAGFLNMARDLPSTTNPLQFYNLHSNDVHAISSAVQMAQQIYKSDKSPDKFGFGLRLNYTPQTGLIIYGGVGLRF